jgi:hypothetical protein
MIFVHADPSDHSKNWLEMLGCISEDASYINLNFMNICRNTALPFWKSSSIWIEQCWRDVLRIVWELDNDIVEFNNRVPINRPISVCFVAAQQFIISITSI